MSYISAIDFFNFLDDRNGRMIIEKACGKPERSNFEYDEGCERIGIPYKQKECYCKTTLCNGTNATLHQSPITLITFLCVFAYLEKSTR